VEGRGQGYSACYANSMFTEIKVNPHMDVETMANAYDVRGWRWRGNEASRGTAAEDL
jgi:hypothetical protein